MNSPLRATSEEDKTFTVVVAAEQEILGNAFTAALRESSRLGNGDAVRCTTPAGLQAAIEGVSLAAAVISFRSITALGIAEIRAIVERNPHMGVAILANVLSRDAIGPIKDWLSIRKAGFGLMLNSSLSNSAEFIQFVKSVSDGRYVLDKDASQLLLTANYFIPSESLTLLTSRELSVLELASNGYHNQAIAQSLGIRRQTVERYMHNIYTKVGNSPEEVSSRSHAIRLFKESSDQSRLGSQTGT